MADIKQGSADPWWAALVSALLLFGGAVWMYYDFTAFENRGGERSMPWVLALVYRYIGKWGIVGFLALGGVGATFHGLTQLRAALGGGARAAPPRRKKRPSGADGPDE